eukprot:14548285-Ditylum_brightwellii.AAC.1
MRVNEGALQRYRKFTDEHSTYLHNHTCLLSTKEKAALPYWGLFRRPKHASSAQPDGNQPDMDEPEVAQQPTYDTSYPTGLTVKWKDHNRIKPKWHSRIHEQNALSQLQDSFVTCQEEMA